MMTLMTVRSFFFSFARNWNAKSDAVFVHIILCNNLYIPYNEL